MSKSDVNGSEIMQEMQKTIKNPTTTKQQQKSENKFEKREEKERRKNLKTKTKTLWRKQPLLVLSIVLTMFGLSQVLLYFIQRSASHK